MTPSIMGSVDWLEKQAFDKGLEEGQVWSATQIAQRSPNWNTCLFPASDG